MPRRIPNAVDAVFGGHTHGSVLGRTPGGVPIAQGGSSGRAVARIDLVRKVDGTREVRSALDTVWADRIRADRGVDSILARYLPAADSVARRRLAEIALPMARRGNEYSLARLLADAYREETLHVGHTVQEEDARDDLVSVLHLFDRFFTLLLREAPVALVFQHSVMNEVLVDGREFRSENLVQEVDDLGVAAHAGIVSGDGGARYPQSSSTRNASRT